MVERIVELTTKLKRELLAENEILECGQVPLILSGTAINISGGVSNIAERRQREHTCVEELVAVS